MVMCVNSSPDPSYRPEENMALADLSALSNSDSEDEYISYEGYAVLPQDFVENNYIQDDDDSQESSNDESNEHNVNLNNEREISEFDRATKLEVSNLWNSTNRPTDIVLDSTKEEFIKNAMAGFKLPSTAIPPWAEQMSEEEWKEQIISRVVNKVTV